MVFIILIVTVILDFNNFRKKNITHVWLGSKHTRVAKIIRLSTNNLRIMVNIDNFGETFFLRSWLALRKKCPY